MRLQLNRPIETIIGARVSDGKFLMYVAEQMIELMEPYVPFDSGKLCESAVAEVKNGRPCVRYDAPYAAKVYEGDGLNFKREKHPLACSRWDSAMFAAKKEELYRRIRRAYEGGKRLAR